MRPLILQLTVTDLRLIMLSKAHPILEDINRILEVARELSSEKSLARLDIPRLFGVNLHVPIGLKFLVEYSLSLRKDELLLPTKL